MASACVNNFSLPPSYGCFSPRISFSHDFPAGNGSDPADDTNADPDLGSSSKDFIDFEFHLNDPVAMLPADELFSDGKLVPLHLAPLKQADPTEVASDEIRLPPGTPLKPAARREEIFGSGPDSFAVSPKAPTCSSRWRELLRLKRQQQTTGHKTEPGSKNSANPKSLKHFLNRNLRFSPSSDPNLSLPLLRDSEPEPLSISSRLSLSSTSSSGCHEADDLPRISLDSENIPNQNPILLNRYPPKVRVSSLRARSGNADGRVSVRAGRSPVRRPPETVVPPPRCASVDSPRMNASGKVVFQGLGRSSSSPSTFNGGPRIKHRGMERSCQAPANVRVTPVLNMPVCSLRGGSKSFGFGQLFSGSGSGSGSSSKSGNGSSIKWKN